MMESQNNNTNKGALLSFRNLFVFLVASVFLVTLNGILGGGGTAMMGKGTAYTGGQQQQQQQALLAQLVETKAEIVRLRQQLENSGVASTPQTKPTPVQMTTNDGKCRRMRPNPTRWSDRVPQQADATNPVFTLHEATVMPRPDPKYATITESAHKTFGYESPLIHFASAKKVWQRFKLLPEESFDYRVPQQIAFWKEHLRQYVGPKEYGLVQRSGSMYPLGDCIMLYTILRYLKPSRVLEIGSGDSTRVARQALERNEQEGHPSEHICIEPYRDQVVYRWSPNARVIKKVVQDVDIKEFEALQPGDVLFIDSSHVTAPYGDTIYELCFILPRIPVGVWVHIHDIFLPFDYPLEWTAAGVRVYTEQYMLAAFLNGNADWEVTWSNRLMLHSHADMFIEDGAFARPKDVQGGSFWMRRVQ